MTLADVFEQVFQEPAATFTDHSSQDNVANWTSLRHVTLLVQVENAFGVKFSNAEMATMRSMADIRTTLHGKGVTAE